MTRRPVPIFNFLHLDRTRHSRPPSPPPAPNPQIYQPIPARACAMARSPRSPLFLLLLAACALAVAAQPAEATVDDADETGRKLLGFGFKKVRAGSNAARRGLPR